MCDAYSEYGGRSVGSATFLGFAHGLIGFSGLGGFWNPVDTGALSRITDDFNSLKKKLQKWEQKYKNNLTKKQEDFKENQLQLMQEIEAFHDEMLEEQIGKNQLLITITFAALVIVIVYLVAL